jgi:hypothetical protein
LYSFTAGLLSCTDSNKFSNFKCSVSVSIDGCLQFFVEQFYFD